MSLASCYHQPKTRRSGPRTRDPPVLTPTPGLEEDLDISVELVNRTFYQANCDGASLAIIADYAGLLPTSRVSQAEKTLSSKEDSFQMSCLTLEVSCFCRDDGRGAGLSP